MHIRPIHSLHVSGKSIVVGQGVSSTHFNIQVDGVKVYGLRVNGACKLNSIQNTVAAFSDDSTTSIKAWFDPATQSAVCVSGVSHSLILLLAIVGCLMAVIYGVSTRNNLGAAFGIVVTIFVVFALLMRGVVSTSLLVDRLRHEYQLINVDGALAKRDD